MIIRRHTDGSGYLFNDNRASHNGLEEADVMACNHCQKLIIVSKWKLDGGLCGCCGQAVCGPCADKILLPADQGGGCIPFIERVRRQLEFNYRRAQNARILGI
jgi:hypothetical protein